MDPIILPIPANTITAARSVSVIQFLEPQATALITLFGTENGRLDNGILAGLDILAEVHHGQHYMVRLYKESCVHCCRANLRCVRPNGWSCALCLGHGHQCSGYDEDADHALLHAVIARAVAQMRADIPGYVDGLLVSLKPRVLAHFPQAASLPVNRQALTRELCVRLHAYLTKSSHDMLQRHVTRHCAMTGGEALAFIRDCMDRGARTVDDLGVVVGQVRDVLRARRDAEMSAEEGRVEGYGRRILEQWLQGMVAASRGAEMAAAQSNASASLNETVGPRAAGGAQSPMAAPTTAGLNVAAGQHGAVVNQHRAEVQIGLATTEHSSTTQNGSTTQHSPASHNALTQNSAAAQETANTPTYPTAIAHSSTRESAGDVIQQALARLPELKAAVVTEVLAELSLDRPGAGGKLHQALDEWEARVRQALCARVPVSSVVDVCEERMREDALNYARGAVGGWRGV